MFIKIQTLNLGRYSSTVELTSGRGYTLHVILMKTPKVDASILDLGWLGRSQWWSLNNGPKEAKEHNLR